MINLLLIPIVTAIQIPFKSPSHFIHLTDMHYDMRYTGGKYCHSNITTDFGRHKCDSTKLLIDTVVMRIKEEKRANFIIWTGDTARHVDDQPQTLEEIIKENEYVTNKLKSLQLPVIPNIGNNDVTPHNVFSAGEGLRRLSELWRPFLPGDAFSDFRQFGYFVRVVDQIAVISLNTLVFFKEAEVDEPSAYHHIIWLKKNLQRLKQEDMKVLVIGHIAPSKELYHRVWYDEYMKLSIEFSDLIIGQLFGHSNLDVANVIKNRDKPVGLILIAPSVTPIMNPSYRVFSYSRDRIIDYEQYYAQLQRYNMNWKLLYKFSDYKLPLTPIGVNELKKNIPTILLKRMVAMRPKYVKQIEDAYSGKQIRRRGFWRKVARLFCQSERCEIALRPLTEK